MSYSDWEAMEERANWGACYEAADRAGYTNDEAESCDDGDRQCPGCPWRPSNTQTEKPCAS
jgi:hypothetical protein